MNSAALSVSVALCTYNGAAYIEQQVESILDQQQLPMELVIADDGSTDDTVARIRSVFARRATTSVSLRILETSSHLGVTGNFERAIAAAESDLIALSDQDDIWHVDRLSAVTPAFESDRDLLLVHSDARLIDANGHPLGLSLFDSLGVSAAEREGITGGHAFGHYLRRNLVTGATTVIRRSLMESAAPFPSEWVHDEWLAIIASAIGSVAIVETELVDYRQHGANEIGVNQPTLRYRIGRILQARGARYSQLAVRASILVERLGPLGVDPTMIALAERKSRFEDVRAALPERRLARLGSVLSEARRGSYRELSSQGSLDIVRDLVQPA
jgi:glycosyltransferase involved in cell wall biosynthesis